MKIIPNGLGAPTGVNGTLRDVVVTDTRAVLKMAHPSDNDRCLLVDIPLAELRQCGYELVKVDPQ